MPSPAAAVKAAALRFMPDNVIQLLKRVRYVNTVRSFWSLEADIMVALWTRLDYVLDIGAHAAGTPASCPRRRGRSVGCTASSPSPRRLRS